MRENPITALPWRKPKVSNQVGLRVVDNLSRLAIVEVLPARYTKCLDGRQDVASRRIEDLLRERE
ncbi:hypothetical protein ACLQ18_12540 [Streptomyces sp. DT193]|uniref:hypothetical protein n=1 Tax=Streptomyces sp. DT193 TaxID=3393418 RepID=UPI003CF47F49